MSPVITNDNNSHILSDSSFDATIDHSWFDPQWWDKQGRITGHATGRSKTYFLQHGSGELVLRHYTRGGLATKISSDKYIWNGLERTRPWREWHLNQILFEKGLPVPRPIAAHVCRDGWYYKGDILTQRINGVRPLHNLIASNEVSEVAAINTGSTIRQFHDNQLYHSDLNINNILINGEGRVFLIDFDKCSIRSGSHWKSGNMDRLERSIRKTGINMDLVKQLMEQIRSGYLSSSK